MFYQLLRNCKYTLTQVSGEFVGKNMEKVNKADIDNSREMDTAFLRFFAFLIKIDR